MATNVCILQNGVRMGLLCLQRNRQVKVILSAADVFRQKIRKCSTSIPQLQGLPLPKLIMREGEPKIVDVKIEERRLSVTFEDDSKGELPSLWLKDNCQCSSCFDKTSLGRNFLMQNLDINIEIGEVNVRGDCVEVTWQDGHRSTYGSKWLHDRAFSERARENYRNFYRLQRKPWGRNLQLETFTYNELKTCDRALLKWLLLMETKGVALIKKTPDDPDAGAQLIDHIGLVKPSHYGRRSPVVVRENSNNLAFSSFKLGLHTDLSQYYHQPGMIFIQTVKQHRGSGGESTISDGLFAVELLRKQQPKAFEMLTRTKIYFWDKGVANISMEQDEFYKISKAPIIGLDSDQNLEMLRVNNQVRDSHLDLPPDQVNAFYEAMKLLDDILYDNAINFKMEDGDIITLDNVRCLHGREAFLSSSDRHLESSYLDWDEALCKRRRLLEKLTLI